MQQAAPIVGIIMNERMVMDTMTYTLATKYVTPVVDFVKGTPVLLPPVMQHYVFDAWLNLVDGILLTGSPSDIHPGRYGEAIKNPKSFFDPTRDETSLNLVQKAIARGLPLLGICRGFQEINVALGGSLHQSVHQTPNLLDHREVISHDKDVSYGFRHSVKAAPEGKLIKIVNAPEWKVNSLHDQGIERLADSLQPEAYAEDGLVEAFSLKNSDHFVLATQWHIEWKPENDPCSAAILSAFGQACAEYKNKRSK